jgi:hypothetical protein
VSNLPGAQAIENYGFDECGAAASRGRNATDGRWVLPPGIPALTCGKMVYSPLQMVYGGALVSTVFKETPFDDLL